MKSTSTYNKPYVCEISGHCNAVITYSFGLSGNPKGIVISHRNLIDSARVVSQYLDLVQEDVISGLLIFNLDYGLNQIFARSTRERPWRCTDSFCPRISSIT